MSEYIYVPSFESNSCVTIDYLNSGYIRVYERTPQINSTISYTDYFVNNHYFSRTGVQSFGNYYTSVNCVDNSRVTSNYYYRSDLDSILVCFLIILIIGFYFPFKIICRMFKRFL